MVAKKKKSAIKKKATKNGSSTYKIEEPPPVPKNSILKNARLLLCDGIDSVNSLLAIYEIYLLWRRKTQGGRGAPPKATQDLLRSMVVMAGSTLDATIKRVIKDSLHDLVLRRSGSLDEAQKFIKRKMLKNLDGSGGGMLAEALLSDNPRDVIVNHMITELTGDSLQSVSQLEKVDNFLGIKVEKNETIVEAFSVRNQIVHDMDSALDERGSRRRRPRKKPEMIGYTRALICVGVEVLKQVDNLLCEPTDKK